MIQLQSIFFNLIIVLLTLKGGQTADIKSLECDFTLDLCQWTDPATVVWNIGDYEKSSFGQPVKEVAEGGFINVQFPFTNKYLLESQVLDKDVEPFCIYFNYYMFGPLTGSLTLQAVNKETEGGKSIKITESVWKREGSQYDDWILGKYHVSPTKGKGDFILQFIVTSKDIALGPIRAESGSCDYNNACDFEDESLCFWTVEPDVRSNFRWFISDGKDSAKDLVGTDITTETGVGHFMRTPKEGNIKSSSSINPTIYLVDNEAKCLSFYFYKSSGNSDILEVESRNTFSPENMIWSSNSVTITKQWIPININLHSNVSNEYFKVSLRATRLTSAATPIAIDELKISPEPCIPTGSCNFNSGLCNYRIKKDKLLVGFGRLDDPHTIKWDPMKNIDPYDLFVYTETQKTDDLAEYSLESPIIAPGLRTCLTFSYELSFIRQASFSINLIPIDTKTPITIWTIDRDVSQESWQTIELQKPLTDYSSKPFKLSFDFSGNQLFLGIDDILIHSCDNDDAPDKSCNNYDGLVNDRCIDIVPSSYYNWQFMHTNQLRQKVVPIFNAGDDQVLAFDLSIPSRTKSISYFYISNLKPFTSYCLKFWYIIDGNLKLNLWKNNLKDDFDEYLIIPPWVSFNNHFGLNWDEAKIQIDDVNPETMIIFGASYTTNSTGIIIIDGFNLIEGECSLNYEYSCDFESEDCIWNNFSGGKLAVTGMGNVYEAKTRWIKISAKGRLPSRDSSLKSIEGNYLTLESAKGEEAIFTFPPIYINNNSSELCLSFAINPVATNKLDIVIEQSGIISLVESSSSPKGYLWLPFETSLKFNPSLAKVVHVYLIGSGSLAIDDITIKMGSCSSQQFTCDDGKKISSSQVCDHKSDCSKGEDEVKCGDCDFSNDLCGYEHDDNASWSVKDGQALVESKFGSFWGSKSSGLTSPSLHPTSPTCKLQFEYNNRQTLVNQLKVLLLFQDGRDTEVWDDDMVSVIKDDIVQIDLGRIPIPFNLQFYVKLSIVYFERQPLSFGSIKMINCGYGDTVSDSKTESYSCKNGYRIASEQVCDSSLDCADGDDETDCDQVKSYSFEDKEAPLYWIDLKNEKVKWSYEKAAGSISYTPPRDHSRGLPGSAYMAVYPVKDLITIPTISNEISLIGPELENINGCSMVFYYNTAGVSLIVSILNSTNTIDLMKIPTSLSFGFKRQRITLKEGDIQGKFNFLFKAKYSQKELSTYNKPYYAVIDDVVIGSSCFFDQSKDPTSKCAHNEYHCKKDDICIPEAKVCDYHSDCSDGSDEQNCGSCKFDQSSSLCGWTNEGEDYWIFINDYSGDITKTNVPISDKPENFIIPDRHTSQIQSILKSPKLGPTSPVCKFSFKYFVRPYATMTIRIKNDQDFTSRVFEMLSSENKWDTREYLLESLSPGYYIQFVLDVASYDLLVELSPAGLADFQFINCNPASDISTLPPTTEVHTNPPVTTTQATTHIITEPPTTSIVTTKIVPTSAPTTKPVTFKPETTSHHDIIVPTEAITISPSENTKSNGVHLGSAPIVLLGISIIVFITIFTALLAKKRIYGRKYSPNGVIPLLERNFSGEEALDHNGAFSFRNLQQSDEQNSID